MCVCIYIYIYNVCIHAKLGPWGGALQRGLAEAAADSRGEGVATMHTINYTLYIYIYIYTHIHICIYTYMYVCL